MASTDHGTRIEVLETRFAAVERGQAEILGSLNSLSEKFASRAHPIAWREIGATIVCCLTIAAYAATFLENQFKKDTAVMQYRLDILEKRTEPLRATRFPTTQ